jgi:hypothetical protein
VPVKTARVYAELAALAQARGYQKVTAAAVQEWRTRGMLPSARSLGRARRPPGRLPRELKDGVLRLCEYRYDRAVRDLRVLTLLLWLEGADIDLSRVRDALVSIRALTDRLVRQVGHPALRAEPEATDADIDAGAEAITRVFAGQRAPEPVGRDDLFNASRDALRLALGRGEPEKTEDLGPLATALGLDRAHTETVAGAGPWLDEPPARALANAMRALFGADAEAAIRATSDEDLLAARPIARHVVAIADTYSEFAFTLPPGAAGLDLFALAGGLQEGPALALYLTVLVPSGARELAAGISRADLEAWRRAAAAGREWLAAHPEVQTDVDARGLNAVLQDTLSRAAG